MILSRKGPWTRQCQEVGRRKGVKELVVIWAYSVVLV
jgi:hypothetical protein